MDAPNTPPPWTRIRGIEIFERIYYFAKRTAKTVATDVTEAEIPRQAA